jgi:lysozyme
MPIRVLWRRARIWVGIGLSLALVALLAWLIAVNWRPSTGDFPVQGVEVSEANGRIDWFHVKANNPVAFVYVRATIGADSRDRRFNRNWRGLFQAGVRRGAVHVFSLCQLAADQAGNFVARVPDSADQLPMALELDFQPDCPARPDRGVVLIEIRHFLEAVEPQMRRPAVLKISKAFEARYRVSEAFPRKLWSVQSFFPPDYFDKGWTMWQANGFRRIEGVAGPVKWNVMAR